MASYTLRLDPAKDAAATPGDVNAIKRAKRKQPWVARVTGAGGKFGVEREFLASTVGPDGRLEFTLSDGEIYEVNANLGWTAQRYFCRVKGDTMAKMSKAEALASLTRRAKP